MSVDQKFVYKKGGVIRDPQREIQEVKQLTLHSFLETSMLSKTKQGEKSALEAAVSISVFYLFSFSKGRPSRFSKNLPQEECIVFCCSAKGRIVNILFACPDRNP